MGTWRDAPRETIETILNSMGAVEGLTPDDIGQFGTSVRLDHPLPPMPAGSLLLEDGAIVRLDGYLPPDLPLGYHQFTPDGGTIRPLIVSPGRCGVPEGDGWGWAAQLYAARSRASWGIGDLADLRQLAKWSASLGARILLTSPLHATAPGTPQEPSPYSASSRIFANPLYLRIEEIPGAADLAALDQLATAGRRLNDDRLIDRDQVWALKSEALEALFARFDTDAAFDAYRQERGAALAGFATWCALAESHGRSSASWPAKFRRPDSPAVRDFAASGTGQIRIRFHTWLQWLLDRQLAAAAAPLELMPDLAIGVDAGGADAWMWQDTFAAEVRVGAPPDEFNTLGQDWGLPPWDPWKLRRAGYQPFIETVRAGLRHAGGLRFDHVMGLFRLYWIPPQGTPAEGTYVRYPYWDLLNILALESVRAGAYVVGEDLGTVEDHVRHELANRRVLSYRLWWFEPQRPAHWPQRAMAAVTTHDLPTVAGMWTGSDLDDQRHLGLVPSEAAAAGLRQRLEEWTDLPPTADIADVIERTYGVLSEAPCHLRTATLDDAAAVTERPNMPGTIDSWPNWRIALPIPLEELEVSPLALGVAARLARASD